MSNTITPISFLDPRHYGRPPISLDGPLAPSVAANQPLLNSDPNGITQSSVLDALNKELRGANATPINELSGQDFSPGAVADRILGFIDGHIKTVKANGASDDEVSKQYDIARKAVAKGFAEARKILDGLGVLTGSIKANVDETFKRINDGLDARQNPDAVPAPTGTEAAGAQNVSNIARQYDESHSFAQTQQFDLSLKTKEGDIVTLHFDRSDVYANSGSISEQSDGKQSTRQAQLSHSETHSSSIRYSVTGDLNDDEKKAIDNVLAGVNKIADQFYAGHTQEALQQASQLDFNSDELQSLKLDLTRSTQASYASRYQQVAALPTSDTSVAPPPAASSFIRDLGAALREADKETALPDSKALFKQLLDKTLETDPRKDDASSPLKDFLQRLLNPPENADASPVATSPQAAPSNEQSTAQ